MAGNRKTERRNPARVCGCAEARADRGKHHANWCGKPGKNGANPRGAARSALQRFREALTHRIGRIARHRVAAPLFREDARNLRMIQIQ